MALFEFRILGSLEVVRGGERLRFRGHREQALLVLFLLHANQALASERLADDLWSGTPPDGALNAVRVYVSRIRQALGNPEDVLVTRPSGYLLQVEMTAIDSHRFESLAAQGRERAAAGDHEGASKAFRDALGLWRGPALADVADFPFARAEATRLEEARLAALEGRLDADLACGRHAELVGELDALTRAHPYREQLWAQRMLALYRSGRQADALRAYSELRHTLGEELGLEPSSALRQLEAAVLRHDPALDWRPAAAPSLAGTAANGDAGGVVTFLFTDLVASTELFDQLGEDAANELRRAHFGLLRDAVASHGGSEIKSLGDGLMVAFSSPLAALACAVEIQQAAAGGALSVRVGLHAGEPVRDEGDFFGTPVVVAKRLCDRAEPGQVLASVLVSDLVGRRGDRFTFRNLGALSLKGLATPVVACEVWPARAGRLPAPEDGPVAGPVPLPRPLARKERLPLVGRAGELGRLQAAWEAAGSVQRQLVLLAGEPGIGKSRLTADFARQIHGEGALVLFGRCEEGMGVPYQPFVEALGRYLKEAPAPTLGRLAGELVRLVPEIGERIHGLPPPVRSDPETERYRLFDAVAAWISAAAEATPVLFVIDDLHWATRPTLLLLSHLIRSEEDVALLLVATFRDTPLDMTPDLADLVAELLRQPDVERMRLPGLDEPAVAALMEAQAGHDLDDDGRALARVLQAETAGNPFFVREILRHLAEKGTILQQGDRWVAGRPVAEVDVPDSIREVVGRRLTRLPDRTDELLAMAAVVGERFQLPVLVAASGDEEASVLRDLEPAVAARLIDETAAGQYDFTHALVRSTLEEALGPTRRAQLHRAAGLALEALHADDLGDYLSSLAQHFARAGDRERAVNYATQAGDQALAQLANDEALAYYRQAIDLLPADSRDDDEQRRLELLIRLGEAERRVGQPEARDTLLRAVRLAQRQGDASAMARAALASSRGTFSTTGSMDEERVQALEAALEALGDTDPGLRARLLAALAVEFLWSDDIDRRLALTDEALALARSSSDPGVLGFVLLQRWATLWPFPWAQDRLDLASELLAVAEFGGDPHLRFWGLWRRCLALMELGDVAAAAEARRAAGAQADELRQAFPRWCVLLSSTTAAGAAGQLADADRGVQQFLAIAPENLEDAGVLYRIQLAGIRYDQGRLGEAQPALAAIVERHSAVPFFRGLLALAYCELGRPDDARAAFRPLLDRHVSTLVTDYFATPAVGVLATVCAELGYAEQGAELAEVIAPYHSQVASHPLVWFGSFSHHLGRLATALSRLTEADAHFAAAAEAHERMGAALWLARTRLEWGRMLLARRAPGDAERSRDLLHQAAAAARDLGASGVERSSEAQLAGSGPD